MKFIAIGGPKTMQLKDICGIICILLKEKPAKEHVYVGEIKLAKGTKEFVFDFAKYANFYDEDSNSLSIFLKNCDYVKVPDGTKLEDLAGAKVTDLFLQGEEDKYVDGQCITAINMVIGYENDINHTMFFPQTAFTNTDFGEYYSLCNNAK